MTVRELYEERIEELKKSATRRQNIIKVTTDKSYTLSIRDLVFPPLDYDEMLNALVKYISIVKIKRGQYLFLFYDENFIILPIDIFEFANYYTLELASDGQLIKIAYLRDIEKYFKDLGIHAKINYLEI